MEKDFCVFCFWTNPYTVFVICHAWVFPNMKLCTHHKTPADGHQYFCYLLFTKGTKEEQGDKVSYMYSLNEFMALGVMMLPHKSHRLTKPPQCQSWNYLLLSSWSEKSKWLPKQHRLLMLPLAATQNLKVRLLLKRSHMLDKGLEDSGWNFPGDLFL